MSKHYKPFLAKPRAVPKKHTRVHFDLETSLIVPGIQAPPISVMGFKVAGEKKVHCIMRKDSAFKPLVRSMLEDKGVLLSAYHARYDIACLMAYEPEWAEIIFQKFEDDGITCTLIRETLLWIAKANPMQMRRKFDLGTTYKMMGGQLIVDKEDKWRERWGQLADLDLKTIKMVAPDALQYVATDVLAEEEVYEHQEKSRSWLLDQYRQTRASFGLYLAQCWGVTTDQAQVEVLHEATLKALDEAAAICKQAGIVRSEEDDGKEGSRNIEKASEYMERAYGKLGLPVPRNPPTKKMKEKARAKAYADALALGKDEETAAQIAEEAEKCLLGNVVLDEEACNNSQDPVMEAYCKTSQSGLLLGKVRRLRRKLIQASYNTLVNTGRTSCRQGKDPKRGKAPSAHGSQMQNPPREVLMDCESCHGTGRLDGVVCIPCKGMGEVPVPGVRECFIARPGYVIVSIDFDAFEMRTWAQVCLWMVGYSKLAEILNDPARCPHVEMGSMILGLELVMAYQWHREKDKRIKTVRGLAKGPNFGLPGGMGAERLVAYCWDSYGVSIAVDKETYDEKSGMTLPSARDIIATWKKVYPEAKKYLDLIGKMTRDTGGRARIIQHWSARVRGGLGYCDTANTFFQGLAADAAKASVWAVTKEAYAVKSSPLYGTRMLAFVHDEGVFEMPMDGLNERCERLQKVWCGAAQELVPDVLITASPAASFRWSKAAGDPVFEERNGKKIIMPYELSKGYKGLPPPEGQIDRWLKQAT